LLALRMVNLPEIYEGRDGIVDVDHFEIRFT
jgi:hypothetical protein